MTRFFRTHPARLLLFATLISLCQACNRAHYREQADAEMFDLIEEKSQHSHWRLPYRLYIDPRSRMYDPFNPDRPPMPPDDPAAHKFMHRVDGKKGYPAWDYNGSTQHVENEEYLQHLPLDENGVLVLNSERAVELALVHSTQYQNNLEELYFSALDVSSERFRFDTQFFGGYDSDWEHSGRNAPGAFGQPTSNLTLAPSGTSARRAFSTGAEMVATFANSLVWQLSGPDTHSASTLIDFSFVQPLLRGAGRDRVMETLTLSERALLANVRQMERYRRGFYLDLITGTGGQSGPGRIGGFSGQSGLGGFAGVGGGGFGAVGNATFGRGGGTAGAAGARGGILGLLQTQQQIRNQEANVAALRSSLAQLEAFQQAGRIDFFQVEQVRQRLFQATSTLLDNRRGYQDQLDGLKRDLGLPPYLKTRIEDDVLGHFNLIDPALIPVQDEISSLQQQVGAAIVTALGNAADATKLKVDAKVLNQVKVLRELVVKSEKLRSELKSNNLTRAANDIKRMRNAIPQRQENSQRLTKTLQRRRAERNVAPGETDVDASLFSLDYLKTLPDELARSLTDLALQLDNNSMKAKAAVGLIDEVLKAGLKVKPEQLALVVRAVPSILTDLAADALELQLVQARARGESVTLIPIDINANEALEIARQYRRDWMNARANLVNLWRRIEFNADQLESSLDVVFDADIRNRGDNPFRLRSSTGSVKVGLEWDAPLTRLQERNTYRQSLIEYQQAKRNYYQSVDGILSGLRASLRQIELNQVNFEIRRAALRVAVAQVQSARLELERPPQQTQPGQNQRLGDVAARNLIDALDGLRQAQDSFLIVWVDYEVRRGVLDLDLGTMDLDEKGMWIDPGPIGLQYGYPKLPPPYSGADGCGDCGPGQPQESVPLGVPRTQAAPAYSPSAELLHMEE